MPSAASSTHDSLDQYVRELAVASPLSASAEKEHAERIRECRLELWRSLLSYAPLAAAITEACEAELEPAQEIQTAAAALRAVSKSTRAARSSAGSAAFEAAAETLAQLMVECDVDGRLAMSVHDDIDTVERGGRDIRLKIERLPSQRSPFLTYAARVRACREALTRAKSRFAQANLRLVVSMAKRYSKSPLALADLIQEGNMGLLRAVDRYDHRRGFRFSTYAAYWIRHSLNRAVHSQARLVRLPVHVLDRQRQIKQTRKKLKAELGRDAQDHEVGKVMRLPQAKVSRNDVAVSRHAHSIDAPLRRSGDSGTLGDTIAEDAPDLSEMLANRQLLGAMQDAFYVLDAVEYDIVRRRFGLDDCAPETLREIGASYSLSRERIRQLQTRALGKLRAELS